jgi:cell division protein FtsL
MESRACLAKIESQNEILRLETAQLKSPQRIQDIAVGQLGMVNPETVYIRDKDVLGRRAAK